MNWGSILAQAQTAMQTQKRQNEVKKKVDDYLLNGRKLASGQIRLPITDAGTKFAEILQRKVQEHAGSNYASGDLGATAVAAASNLSANKPYKSGGMYYVDVNFRGNHHRESLMPDKYDGIDNIIALLNTGYNAGHIVKGIWKGHGGDIRVSLRDREGAQFIQEAVAEFMSTYADQYGVVDINISEEYE